MKKIKFEITTPERVVYTDEVDSITIPTAKGEITVLPDHIPLIALLVPGELHIKKGNQEELMAVSGGFIEVRKDKVIVLSDTAELAHEIDVEAVEEAKKRAEKLLQEKRTDQVDYVGLSANLERELARLKVGKKYKRLKGLSTDTKNN
jgi:F-type H+-transporting ATPase subunit epsilon